MNATQLKAAYQRNNPEGYFFERDTMKFFGDTMKNYRVTGPLEGMYTLSRRKPVKHGVQKDAFFCATTFKLLSPLAWG